MNIFKKIDSEAYSNLVKKREIDFISVFGSSISRKEIYKRGYDYFNSWLEWYKMKKNNNQH